MNLKQAKTCMFCFYRSGRIDEDRPTDYEIVDTCQWHNKDLPFSPDFLSYYVCDSFRVKPPKKTVINPVEAAKLWHSAELTSKSKS